MSVSKDFTDFVAEQMSVIGPVEPRKMFGGVGIFRQGLMIALIAEDVVYLKVDDQNRPDFEAEGLEPFSYATKGGRNTIMSFMRCPERAFDDGEDMHRWASAALAAAQRANSRKQGGAKSTSGKRKAKGRAAAKPGK